MKIKNIKINIKNREDALQKFAKTLLQARKKEAIHPHDELSFQNVKAFRQVFTQKRMELLHLIKKHKPHSIYELSQLSRRDLKSINTDIQFLKELDLISLKKENDGRNRVEPHIDFDTLRVDIAI